MKGVRQVHLEVAELRRQWIAALSDSRRAHPVRLIDDRREVEQFASPSDVPQIVDDFVLMADAFRGGRIALVAGTAVTFGMARLFEARTAQLPFEVRAFYAIEEAEAWISGT